MRRHPTIGLTVLVGVLSGCSGEPPPPGPVISTPPVIETVVVKPKHVDEKTRCADYLSVDEVSAATGAVATLRNDGAYGCDYRLVRHDGKYGGSVVVSLGGRLGPSGGLPAVATSVSGNTAIEQRSGPRDCDFWVIIDGSAPPGAWGAVLWLRVHLQTDSDPCRAARELVEKGFARLPDG